jgi:hypothetical protein
MAHTAIVTEADILADVVGPNRGGLDPRTAKVLLGMRFSEQATRRIRRLLARNQEETITTQELAVLDKYLRVGQFLDLLQAKARLSLDQHAGSP